MPIGERIAKSTERQEALTQSVEFLTNDWNELQGLVSRLAERTARLPHGAEIHERCITRLEGTYS